MIVEQHETEINMRRIQAGEKGRRKAKDVRNDEIIFELVTELKNGKFDNADGGDEGGDLLEFLDLMEIQLQKDPNIIRNEDGDNEEEIVIDEVASQP
jgi:hypothetical protein